LTRATIKPRVALQFWDRVPDISNVIGQNNDVLFKIGIGEVPFLHQITFSIWPSTQSMAQFARHDGPHAKAISAVRKGLWFKEELYARFAILDSQGCWMGQDPLRMKDTQ
jgi:spheroidene monooxygenase